MGFIDGKAYPAYLVAKKLVKAFAYADTGTLDNMSFHKVDELAWGSRYGTVRVTRHFGDLVDVDVVMEASCTYSLIAMSLSIFEYLIEGTGLDVQYASITNPDGTFDVKMKDLSASSLSKPTRKWPLYTPKEWWDSNVLPILEKIW